MNCKVAFAAVAAATVVLSATAPVLAQTAAARPGAAQPRASQPGATPAYSVATSRIGVLIDNEQTRAVLQKHVPGLLTHPQLGMARGMTLKAVQPYAANVLTDAVLARIDADLAVIPAS